MFIQMKGGNEKMAENNKVLLTVLACLVILSLICSFALYASLNNKVKSIAKPDFTPVNDKLTVLSNNDAALGAKLDDLSAKINSPSGNETAAVDNSGYTLTKKEYESQTKEAKALELATEFVNSKDFSKLALTTFEDNCPVGDEAKCSIDSYRDITQLKIKDTNVDRIDSTTYEVTFEGVKVYYFVDGDEEQTEKALLQDFVVVVNDVNYDKNFIDAEADEDVSLNISKVY